MSDRGSAALSGAAAAVCLFVGGILTDHGGKGLEPTQSATEIGKRFAELTGQARTGAALTGAATALLLIFLGPLWTHMRRGPSWLAVIAVAGGITVAVFILLSSFLAIDAKTAGEVGDGRTARTLLILEWETIRAIAPPSLAMVAAATLAGLRYHAFSRAFSAFSVVASVIIAVALFPIGPAGLMGFVGVIWILSLPTES